MVTGNEIPFKVNSELFRLTEETVTLSPVALSVAARLALVPTTTFPKLRVLGLTDGPLAGVPVPIKESKVGILEVLVKNDAVAEAAPVDCGVNVTLNCTLLPAPMVAGNEIPFKVNSELSRLNEETVTPSPVALSVAGRLALVPTTTFPKLRLLGLTDCPLAAPVPESGIFKLGSEASEAIVRFPLRLAADCGVKVTLKVKLCPELSVAGRERPLRLNPVPVSVS